MSLPQFQHSFHSNSYKATSRAIALVHTLAPPNMMAVASFSSCRCCSVRCCFVANFSYSLTLIHSVSLCVAQNRLHTHTQGPLNARCFIGTHTPESTEFVECSVFTQSWQICYWFFPSVHLFCAYLFETHSLCF